MNTMRYMVGESIFELPTSCSQGKRADQTAPLPERKSAAILVPHAWSGKPACRNRRDVGLDFPTPPAL